MKGSPQKRLYDWLLHWAESPYGGVVLFIWAFAESSVFPIPPDAFLIAMVLGARLRAFHFATWTSIASVVGGIAATLSRSHSQRRLTPLFTLQLLIQPVL